MNAASLCTQSFTQATHVDKLNMYQYKHNYEWSPFGIWLARVLMFADDSTHVVQHKHIKN